MKKSVMRAFLFGGALASMVGAEGFSQTPKKETLADAIRFEKYKIAAAEAQAKKDAAESSTASRSAQTRKARKQGQADSVKPQNQPAPAPVK
jgi:hypothetical protein